MEKQIITFSANEQKLQKTGGIDCYASNTVAYIEAHFDLGTNWSGYDSVRAVWFTDFVGGISTVLDSDGVCIVPHEVLTRKSAVKVNLVGSIAENDVLTDRLTTCPVVALTIKCNAKITGTETAEVTPSQFEQFVATVIAEVEKVTGMTAVAETLPSGSQATARYENGVLTIGIPQGAQGEQGESGVGIASVTLNADYTLTITMTDGSSITTTSIRGERGEKGETGADGITPSISIGNVETLEPNEDAYVTRRGTDAEPIFDFGIPKGDKGEDAVIPWDDILPVDTASGSIVTITDGQSVVPAKSLKVQLEPIQDLHGYDKPWSGGSGVNKLIQGETRAFTSNGVTWTANADGSITARGTATGASTFTYILTNKVGYNFNGNYKFVCFPSIPTAQMASGIYIGKWIGVYPNTTTSLNDVNAQIGQLWFQIKDGRTVDVTFYPMIYSASETAPTSWTPYSNICPISGHTEVNTIVSPTQSASDGTTYTTPLGQTVYGGVLDVVSGELVVDRAYIASYNGEALPSTWISDRDEYASGTTPTTGAQVVYKLATPTTIQLTPQEVKLLLGNNTIWSDGEVAIVYSADVTKYIEKKLGN